VQNNFLESAARAEAPILPPPHFGHLSKFERSKQIEAACISVGALAYFTVIGKRKQASPTALP
jgi:hypothetical protein